ncbi:MAG TPA: lipoprotein signal peptidase [Flavihumibacter sp.]
MSKARNLIILILLILVADQALKIWVKTNMPLSYHWDASHQPLTPYDRGIRLFGENAEWAQLYFVENEGMAWGWKFGGDFGKIALTLFRVIAVIFGVWYIRSILKKPHHPGFIVCVGLIFAGAAGNLIDSLFYGMIFEQSTYTHVAKMFPEQGYAGFLHGKVVDMFYFPIIRTTWPDWMPFVGGEDFEFFSPVFNLADASISVGVIALLLFQNRFMGKPEKPKNQPIETSTRVNDDVQVS